MPGVQGQKHLPPAGRIYFLSELRVRLAEGCGPMTAPTAPKFPIKSTVWYDEYPAVITEIYWDRVLDEVRYGLAADSGAHYHNVLEASLSLAPPEPLAPKWEVEWDGRLGKLWKGGEFLGTLRDKGLAEFVRDYLNEQAQ